ncbi:MAG: TonB-dependent receptor [Pseudomonadota bacterium]
MTPFLNTAIFKRAGLIAGASVLALSMAGEAAAQASLDSIIVTAQKRDENQQEVPISVETLSQERLSDIIAAGEDIRALAARIPSLYAESSNGRYAPRFYIRGLGNVDFDLAGSQPVSIVMDDVVLENAILKAAPLFDIQQVEVSRGPQGTLFGRNTPAGVVKFTTAKPTNEFDAYGQFAYGTHDTITAQTGIGGPLIEDRLSIRLSGLYQRRSNWVDNGFTGENDVIGGFEDIAGRIQLLYTPSEDIDILLNFHGRNYDGTSALFRANTIRRGGGLETANFDRDTVFFDGGQNNPQETDSWGGSAKLDWRFGGVTLTSITSYETADGSSLGDIDGGFVGPNSFFDPANAPSPLTSDTIAFPAETRDAIDELDQFTQEIRLASNGSGPLNWQVGFFYFDTEFDVSTVGPGFPPLTTLRHGIDSWALFAQASYDLTDALTVTGGVRYTEDNRDFEAVVLPPAVTVNPTSISDEDFSWDVSGLYRVSDGFNLYARVARGFRGPAIQGRDVAFAAFSGAVDPQTVADSETILSFEAGFKSELWENRARLNANAFYYRVNDQQFSIIGGAGNINQVINADKGVGWGFEADAEAVITDNLFVSAGFAYNNTEIQDDDLATATCGSGLCTVTDPLNAFGQALIDGNPFPNALELTFNAFAEYTMPYRDKGEFFVNTDWAVQGKTNFLLYETLEFRSSGNFEGGVRVGYRTADDKVEGAFFARNITDEVNLKGAIDFNNLTGFFNEPRIVGFQITVRN